MNREFGATSCVLEMFSKILATAGRWLGDAAIDIVPALATNLPSDLALIDQIARHAGAPILVASSGAFPAVDGVEPSASVEVLRPVIEAVELPLGRLELSEVGPGRCAVRVAGESTPANPGMRNFLGAVTCMLDARLAGARIAVVAYDETNIDEAARGVLWNLLTHGIPESGAPMPRTLVIIVGNDEVTPRHLDADPWIRYILRPEGLQERHARSVELREVAELAAGDDPLIIFLGAGASASSGLPLGNTLRNEALRNFFHDRAATPVSELIRDFFTWVSDQGRLLTTEVDRDEEYFIRTLTLERVLREERYRLSPGAESETLRGFAQLEAGAIASPGSGVLALRELIGIRPRLIIVTVNFDRLVESAATNVCVLTTDEEFARGLTRLKRYVKTGRGAVPVLKLHGSIESVDSIVANVDLTSLGLSTAKVNALTAIVGGSDSPHKWVYVGYSMRDLDIMAELRGSRFVDGANERWVSPMSDPTVEQVASETRVPLWRARGVPSSLYERTISLTADMFFQELLRAVGNTR